MSDTGNHGGSSAGQLAPENRAAVTGSTGATLRVSQQPRDAAWDSLLALIPGSHFEQTSGWGAVKARYGWQVLRILAEVKGNTVGGVQILTRRLGRLGKIGYVARGPAVLPGHAEVEKLLADQVGQRAKEESWLYVVFDYPYGSQTLASDMAASGYFAHPAGIPPSGLQSATLVVDLDPDEESLLGLMNSSVRRNIRRAQRSDLTFAEAGVADLPRFRELMLATCARQHSSPTPPQADFFENLFAELAAPGVVRLFLVRAGDEIVTAQVAFTLSDTIRVWKTGWSGAHGDKYPNHLMLWEIMKWGKARGFRKFDMVSIDGEDARRAARGERSPEGFRNGTTYFKLGFGGDLLFCPPVQSRFFNPLFSLAFRCGGARILASNVFQRALSRYWQQASRE